MPFLVVIVVQQETELYQEVLNTDSVQRQDDYYARFTGFSEALNMGFNTNLPLIFH